MTVSTALITNRHRARLQRQIMQEGDILPGIICLPSLPSVGPAMSILSRDYIDFNKSREKILDLVAIEIKKNPCAKKRRVKVGRETNQDRVRSWLINSIHADIRGKETALSRAFIIACRKSLKKHHTCDPIRIEVNIKIADFERKQAKKKATAPIRGIDGRTKEYIREAFKKNWVLQNDGSFIRATPKLPGTNKFSSPPTSSYMSRSEEKKYATRVAGEVHCG